MARLQTFFDVETHIEDQDFSGEEFIELLNGKAGVMTDSRHLFDAALICRVPTLKAVCNLDASHDNMDLPVLTSAGIRATNTPQAVSGSTSSMTSMARRWGAKPSLSGLVMDPDADVYPEFTSDDPTRVAAENLVASLGFGRYGWHPPHLINKEILCESCC